MKNMKHLYLECNIRNEFYREIRKVLILLMIVLVRLTGCETEKSKDNYSVEEYWVSNNILNAVI